jgi:Flp pilus assembly protein TadG
MTLMPGQNFRSSGRNRGPRRRGAIVVEMACIAPFLFLVMFACFEFTRLEFLRGAAQIASYDAARFVMVPGARKEEGVQVASNVLQRCGAKNPTVEVHVFDQSGEQPEITDATKAVTVRVEVSMSNNIFSLARFVRNHRIIAQTTLTSDLFDEEN